MDSKLFLEELWSGVKQTAKTTKSFIEELNIDNQKNKHHLQLSQIMQFCEITTPEKITF